MRRIKLAVILCSAVLMATFYFSQPARTAKGRAAGEALAPPTGLTASDSDYAGKVGLHWQPIRGATLYRIFRNAVDNSSTATDVGTTQANYFFDTSAVAGATSFYWVRAENSQTTSGFSNSDQGRRAIGDPDPGPPFPPLQPPLAPAGNPVTAAKAYLGKTLFWDEQLSSTKTVSCGTCHRPAEGGSDPRTSASTRNPGPDQTFATPDDIFGSPGVPVNFSNGNYGSSNNYGLGLQVTGRKSPSYLNAGYSDLGLFWDGRATDAFRDPITNTILLGSNASLESQSVGPPLSDSEMGHTGRDWPQVAARITASKPLALAHDIPVGLSAWIDGRTYPELFEEAFGTPEITAARIALAIGTHERTLFTDRTPLHRYTANIGTLTTQEADGLDFFLAAQCNFCHGGSLLSDRAFHNISVRPPAEDLGRGGITGNPGDNAKFKTPSLLNLELRAPFMHNGRFATVEDVVEFYNDGGGAFPHAPNHDPRVQNLNLTNEAKASLAAFLKRPLTDDRVRSELPPFDRPKLYTESSHVPVVSGSGRTGTGGLTPNAIAIEPPLVGNPSFTVAVSGALGGAPAVVVIGSADPGVGASIPPTGSFARVEVTLGGSGQAGFGSANLSIPDNPALIGRTFYGRWYVADAAATNGFAVSRLFQFTIFGDGAVANRTPFDFDGDRKSDVGIFRPAVAEWWIYRSATNSVFAAQFGAPTDKVVPADFTGDGKYDVAFWRPATGEWFIVRSEDNTYYSAPFGAGSDIPVPADYDADGKADVAVFRPSDGYWYVQRSSDNQTTAQLFGQNGDLPIASDYDGDGRADVAIYRPSVGEWWLNRTTAGVIAYGFGSVTDKVVPGDYTGDGKTDVAFWRPATGEWFVLRSEDTSYFSAPFGADGDMPAPGDYDGDGKFDVTVFRPSTGTWYVNRTSGGTTAQQFGATGDLPLERAFLH